MPESPSSIPVIAFSECLQQAGPHDLVLTASNRLARDMRQRFAQNGKALLPRVVPYATWLSDSWQRLRFEDVLSGSKSQELVLLSDEQEEVLWDRALRESGAQEQLLFLDETVRACQRAYGLMEQYLLPRDHASWQRSEESRLFLEWMRVVETCCQRNGWLPPARLAAWLATRAEDLPDLAGRRVFLAGFDETNPAQDLLLAALQRVAGSLQAVEEPAREAAAQAWLHEATDAEAEWRAAANWAAHRSREFPDGRFAVVVPDLAASHARVSRIFQDVFRPAAAAQAGPGGKAEFHLSFAPPLAQSPLAQAALYLLDALHEAPILSVFRYLLRTPYADGAGEESEARALLEAGLLGERLDRVPFERLRRTATELLSRQRALRLTRWQALVARLEDALSRSREMPERAPSAWVGFVRALWLQNLWLDASLTSAEFQARQRLLDELGAMRTLDLVMPACGLAQFVRILRGRLERAGFQAEAPGGQVLVAGMFEVTGLDFDGVWICGLTDKTLPRPITPDPFLPLELQRMGALPRADVAREREFAGKLFRRLCALGTELVLSYAQRDGDEEQQPSPLLGTLPALARVPAEMLPVEETAMQNAEADLLEDWDGGVFAPGEERLRGGATLLKNQSDCPFRAYAVARLGSEAMEWQAPLMDRLDQGSLIHKALEEFWGHTKSRDALQALDDAQRAQRIAQCVEAALAKFQAEPDDALALAQKDAERERLQAILTAWLEEEDARQPFTVDQTEAKRTMAVGVSTLRLRPDRVDLLQDGAVALIDYKTGEVDPKKWLGDRPEEPQLLAYLAVEPRRVGALAFASLKAGKMGWKAYGNAVAANFKPLEGKEQGEPPEGWDAFVAESRTVVERLVAEFTGGFAPVDPRNPRVTCTYCTQQPFCRIGEAARDADGDEDGGEIA